MVMAAVGSIKAQAPPRAMVIIESTVGVLDPVEKILPAVKSIRPDARLAYCPERALPGNTLSEMVYNDRVIGADDEAAGRQAAQLYRRFVKGKISRTDLTTAAAVKLLENTYRSVNIALANQLAQIAEHAGFDAWQAIELANKHPRVNVHRPGPGVGGHCLPIDPWFLAGADLDHSSLIRLALEINAAMPRYVAGRVGALAAQLRLSSLTIGLLGLSYKADVDDIRESPGLELAALLDKRVTVLAHDPHVTSRPPDHPNIRLVPLSQLHRQAQLVVIAVDHQEFSKLDWGKFRRLKAVIDTRQTLSPTTVEELRARQVVVSQLGVPQAPKKVPIRL
ncbi:MAG: UDP-N-acetyl-D-mannosamine dehydrogenase [Candidatus Pacebacteria bacterium CG10_big_fil_rev_8_21_14_0_10_56_10]|nr:MAG: UDP-N-acetyl-D-mannosamine dehydrogenase [Candidatus Pacebacteria bacterium CG10_big_fil_rev_8_21_14_0_10_56_10]